MAKQNRATLKKYFADGALPTAKQFGDLIESNLNMQDEGFSKSTENGYEIIDQGKKTRLVSFFRVGQPDLVPWWSIKFDDKEQKNLVITYTHTDNTSKKNGSDEEAPPALTLKPNGCVGILNDDPRHQLDVQGAIRSEKRFGTVPSRELEPDDQDYVEKPRQHPDEDDKEGPVLADGKWHNITSALRGCHALEVVAGVGNKKTGRYALLHTVALNTFNPRGWFFNFLGLKNRLWGRQAIRQSYYFSRANKLSLRWVGGEYRYFLQIKTNADYRKHRDDPPIRIKYHITELWDDETMSECWGYEKSNGNSN